MTGSFDERLRQERLTQAALAAEQAKRSAEHQRLIDQAVEKMESLVAGFARQATLVGWEPRAVVLLETKKMLVKDGLFTRKLEDVACFVEVVGEGWVVSDPSNLTEYGDVSTSFLVLTQGHWIDIGHMKTRSYFTEGKDIHGLPRELQAQKLVALKPDEWSQGVELVYPSFVMNGTAEGLMAKELIRQEAQRSGRGS